MFKKSYPCRRVRPVRPKRSRRKGRNCSDARSVRFVRERECREERQVCEPEGGKMATMSGQSQRTLLAVFPNIFKMKGAPCKYLLDNKEGICLNGAPELVG